MKIFNGLIQKVEAADSVNYTTVYNPFGNNITTVAQIFNFIINLIIGVGWSLVIVMVALGFMQYVVSQGEKTQTEKAQKWLTYAVVGGVGLFFVMVIRNVLPTLVGTDAGNISNGTGGGLAL